MASQGPSSSATEKAAFVLITEAVEQFKATIGTQDQNKIQNTRVDDVLAAMKDIQKGLLLRRENRNLAKLEKFTQGLQKYSGVIDALSNGLSPYLPWIWVS